MWVEPRSQTLPARCENGGVGGSADIFFIGVMMIVYLILLVKLCGKNW